MLSASRPLLPGHTAATSHPRHVAALAVAIQERPAAAVPARRRNAKGPTEEETNMALKALAELPPRERVLLHELMATRQQVARLLTMQETLIAVMQNTMLDAGASAGALPPAGTSTQGSLSASALVPQQSAPQQLHTPALQPAGSSAVHSVAASSNGASTSRHRVEVSQSQDSWISRVAQAVPDQQLPTAQPHSFGLDERSSNSHSQHSPSSSGSHPQHDSKNQAKNDGAWWYN